MDVRKLPIVTFWMLHKNIDRQLAERDIRQLQVVASAHTGDAIGKMMDNLTKQAGTIVEYDGDAPPREEEKLDRSGLQALKHRNKTTGVAG